MNIDAARKDVSEIIRTLGSQLDETRRMADCESLAGRALKRLEDVRKKFQRVIDERLLGRPGRQRFAIHEREAMQELLNKLVSEAVSHIEAIVCACRKRIADQSCQREPTTTRVLKS